MIEVYKIRHGEEKKQVEIFSSDLMILETRFPSDRQFQDLGVGGENLLLTI